MFNNLKPQPADPILALTDAYRADERAGKIDLGVGVYKNADGHTPVMHAVKAAESLIWQTQDTKVYTALVGEADYRFGMMHLVLGKNHAREDWASSSTVGGTGAVRLALELLQLVNPEATVWHSDPTWPNHLGIMRAVGVQFRPYRYFSDGQFTIDGMLEDLREAKKGDVVLLHGCCHNPTGANPTNEEWQKIADLLAERGLIAFVDLAYQGFGDGLKEDAFATRLLAEKVDEILIAASCSKNFGIYRERTGVLLAKSKSAAAEVVQANMAAINRVHFSFPPDHGARVVSTILQDMTLRQSWANELEGVRLGMLRLRQNLAAALRASTGSDRFDFVAEHRGMFSRLGLTPEQVALLQKEHAVYMTSDSRINIAGLNTETTGRLAEAVAKVI